MQSQKRANFGLSPTDNESQEIYYNGDNWNVSRVGDPNTTVPTNCTANQL